MFGSTSKEHKGGWCGCCDGKDDKCRCVCHRPWVAYFFKGFFALVILIFVFAFGVWVGKLSSWWHAYRSAYSYRDDYPDYRMMRPGQNMMNPYQPLPGGMMPQYPNQQQWGR